MATSDFTSYNVYIYMFEKLVKHVALKQLGW